MITFHLILHMLGVKHPETKIKVKSSIKLCQMIISYMKNDIYSMFLYFLNLLDIQANKKIAFLREPKLYFSSLGLFYLIMNNLEECMRCFSMGNIDIYIQSKFIRVFVAFSENDTLYCSEIEDESVFLPILVLLAFLVNLSETRKIVALINDGSFTESINAFKSFIDECDDDDIINNKFFRYMMS